MGTMPSNHGVRFCEGFSHKIECKDNKNNCDGDHWYTGKTNLICQHETSKLCWKELWQHFDVFSLIDIVLDSI